jgi:hypothetical protein
MAVTAIGTNTVTAIARQYIVPRIVDQVYGSNVLFARWNKMNKIVIKGGTQIEFPLMYTKMAAGGWYSGYQLLNVQPTDSIQNGALAWKQAYSAVTVDGLTLLRTDGADSIVDYIATQFKQSEMDLFDTLGTGLFGDGLALPLQIDGLAEIIDGAGTVEATYATISKSSNTWWQSQLDSSTTTMSLVALNNMFMNCTSGGRSPTIIVSNNTNYSRYWNLNLAPQQFPVQPGGKDVQLAQAGFENLLFNGVPWVTDSHVGTTAALGGPIFLNEDYFELIVSEMANFKLQDFQTPVNQDAMTALLLWAGNVVCGNLARQGRFTALTG